MDRYFPAFAEEPDPKVRATMLDEGLAVVTGLWTSQPFSFHGTHYHVDQVRLYRLLSNRRVFRCGSRLGGPIASRCVVPPSGMACI
jgi:hypothetical protein